MQRTVKLFVIPNGGRSLPAPRPDFVVEGATVDELKRNAQNHLVAQGLRVRSVTFTSTGLLAYSEVSA